MPLTGTIRHGCNTVIAHCASVERPQLHARTRPDATSAERRRPHSSGVHMSMRSVQSPGVLAAKSKQHTNVKSRAQVNAASSPAATAVSTTIVLKQCELSFGDTVKAVGESDLFGSWDSSKAPDLQWQEGHDWQTMMDVPAGVCSFKLVILNGSGAATWESGDNRSVMVPADASGGHVTITCHFNQTASTEVQVTPAAAAQQSDTGPQTAQPPVDDLTDDFAAGDAAVQVPAVEERAEQVQERAESVSKSAPADSPQQEATAQVGQTVMGAAPEEDLGDTLSVLQGADSKLEEQTQPQAALDREDGPAGPSDQAEADAGSAQAQISDAEQSSNESQGWLLRLAKASKNLLSLD
ncbi:hypothetical protein ABBQ32_010103 [Trebouxia sp. C0010 RCD-2024]